MSLTLGHVRIEPLYLKVLNWPSKDRGLPMDDIDDLRKHRRNRTLKEGQIVYNSGSSLIDCIIRDRSESGAKLRLPAETVLPKSFELLSVADGLLYPAEIKWRRGDEVGVMFVGAPTPAPPSKR